MRLIKCYIENFGLLRTTEFNFSKGLNCCISDNGTGKTTLTAFIEAMLYGIGDSRRQSLDENPRKKYMPWQGGKFGGSLTVEVGKKKYVIERSFGQRPADDTFRLLEAETGKISYDYGEDIGERLFGIDRDGFLRTVFLSEKNLQGKNENKSISAKLSDLVGVDGDVGGFDDAMKLLEERRKFYFKKGNTGEIANVKERITEKEREIERLAQLKIQAGEKEKRLAELTAERARLTSLEENERKKLEGIHRQKERTVHEERYSAMLEALKNEEARLKSAEEFFKSGLPTPREIDGARDLFMEGKRLNDEALAEKGNDEFVALKEFFSRGTDFAEIAEIERCAELSEEKSRELAALNNGFDEASVKMRTLFPNRVPKREEIEKAKRSRGGKKTGSALCLILGIIAVAGGALLGGMPGITILGVGALISLISLIFLIKPSKSKELLVFLKKFELDGQNPKAAITELENKLDLYEQLEKGRRERLEILNEEYCSLTMKTSAFLGKFPITDEDSMLGAVRLIKSKYAQYYSMCASEETATGGKVQKLQKSDDLIKEATRFLSKYPTKTADPFTEIRDKLSEYNYLRANIVSLNRECDTYAVKYNVTGKSTAQNSNDEAAVRSAIADLSERLKALNAEYAVSARELDLERGEIEREDEIAMAKEELCELYAKHVKNLELIKKTSGYLKEACDNITSKYLGKTKEKFAEYSKLIAGADGEYSLNTSFELTKTERGEAHSIESYSRGTRDLYALGLRLALVDALYENEPPFIILDDPFIAFDDEKLERAKTTLKAIGKSKQILYFTCSKAREIV